MTLAQVLALSNALHKFRTYAHYESIGHDEAIALCEAWRTTGVYVGLKASNLFDHYNSICCLVTHDEEEQGPITQLKRMAARRCAMAILEEAFPKEEDGEPLIPPSDPVPPASPSAEELPL